MFARVRHRRNASHGYGERGIWIARVLPDQEALVLSTGPGRELGPRVHLEDVNLALWARLVYLLTVLTEVIAVGTDYRKRQFRHVVKRDRRVTLCQVVDEHSTTFEAQQTVVTLVDIAIIVHAKLSLNHCTTINEFCLRLCVSVEIELKLDWQGCKKV